MARHQAVRTRSETKGGCVTGNRKAAQVKGTVYEGEQPSERLRMSLARSSDLPGYNYVSDAVLETPLGTTQAQTLPSWAL